MKKSEICPSWEVNTCKAQSQHKHVRSTRAMQSPYVIMSTPCVPTNDVFTTKHTCSADKNFLIRQDTQITMKQESRHAQQMYIGQVHIKRPIADTAWYPAHIFEHGYQLISAARRHMVIMRTWPLHTVHCTCVAVWHKIRARSCCQPDGRGRAVCKRQRARTRGIL